MGLASKSTRQPHVLGRDLWADWCPTDGEVKFESWVHALKILSNTNSCFSWLFFPGWHMQMCPPPAMTGALKHVKSPAGTPSTMSFSWNPDTWLGSWLGAFTCSAGFFRLSLFCNNINSFLHRKQKWTNKSFQPFWDCSHKCSTDQSYCGLGPRPIVSSFCPVLLIHLLTSKKQEMHGKQIRQGSVR